MFYGCLFCKQLNIDVDVGTYVVAGADDVDLI